ncbi:MAG: B12-binding domain-containing radical SAM protein [Phycisphaerae bacterium]|nr:B12-binding domain-containing radical SAM protein [Phycisphaerae bacterium]MCZ2401192.1 B12-binding domain-containing radical SAM protein [Phycisphaerae bacterium]NUQ49723.1 B12-binding domain-containing radical SAM protein [Phycisphaerae bacterium]
MKIGLIAFSGIRAASQELMDVGLTLPGVVERSRVIASMPSLSLLTLAALTPPEFAVEYREIHDLRREGPLPDDYDLVALATFTAQVRDAYTVADHYRARGVPVVMGGLHVSMLPDEAAEHATTVVVGEGERAWPRLLADLAAGRLQPRYEAATNGRGALGGAPVPRYELLEHGRYNRLTVQTSRGCPYVCDFCASSILLTPRYEVKPVDRVIAEVRRIKEIWPRPFIEFADDNSFVNRAHYKRLLAALRDEDVRWFTETDISIADDPALLELMRAAGCRQVLIGLESPAPAALDGIELQRNFKLARQPDYAAAIRRIQSHGITVNGCFILGLDGDNGETFEAVYRFAEQTSLFDVQLTVLTPFPGTPLYRRLARERRLIEPTAWHKCTLFDVNFVPRNMTPGELQRGLIDLARRVYDPGFVERRRRGFFEQLHAAGGAAPHLE